MEANSETEDDAVRADLAEPDNGPETSPTTTNAETGQPASGGGDTPPAAEAPLDELGTLAAETQRRRLSVPDEERLTKLLQETLLDGREGVTRAIDLLPRLPWVVAVNAVTNVWLEMKPTFRTRLLAGLGRIETEASRRVRLSLARGIFKLDGPAALKIATSTVKDMREKEGPPISGKNAHIFANVFIGRAKPWVAQLPLADLKPAEAALLVQTGVLSAFVVPHPPASQLGILKWAAQDGRLAALSSEVLEIVVKGLGRWNNKWRLALKREVEGLPEAISTGLNLDALAAPAQAPAAEGAPEGEATAPAAVDDESDADDDDDDDDENEDDEAEGDAEAKPAAQEGRKQRPVYESKTVPRRPEYVPREQREQREPREQREGREQRDPRDNREGRENRDAREGRPFNLPDALRQIDSYVAGLKNELQQVQHRLRQREEDPRRSRRESAPAPHPGETLSPDELARLNQQLELRNTELQTRLDELREDAEVRAASAADAAGEAASDPLAQIRALLALKLQDDYADFLALEQGGPDTVVKQHYPVLLRHVFEVLKNEGVAFTMPAPEQ